MTKTGECAGAALEQGALVSDFQYFSKGKQRQ
jgi:hypothetical protein